MKMSRNPAGSDSRSEVWVCRTQLGETEDSGDCFPHNAPDNSACLTSLLHTCHCVHCFSTARVSQSRGSTFETVLKTKATDRALWHSTLLWHMNTLILFSKLNIHPVWPSSWLWRACTALKHVTESEDGGEGGDYDSSVCDGLLHLWHAHESGAAPRLMGKWKAGSGVVEPRVYNVVQMNKPKHSEQNKCFQYTCARDTEMWIYWPWHTKRQIKSPCNFNFKIESYENWKAKYFIKKCISPH